MSFHSYLESHYGVACELQRNISRDPQMIAMLKEGPPAPSLVKSWMKDYGLFQGITGRDRDAVVRCFLGFAGSHRRQRTISDDVVKTLYDGLFSALYSEVPRSWMSATSKLLWCLYPESIVIYDAFVLRALVVMQRIDADLSGLDRIGSPPTIKMKADIERATAYYLRYQIMVRRLKSVHAATLDELRQRNHETYPYDIRIMDKLLWMLGNPKRDY